MHTYTLWCQRANISAWASLAPESPRQAGQPILPLSHSILWNRLALLGTTVGMLCLHGGQSHATFLLPIFLLPSQHSTVPSGTDDFHIDIGLTAADFKPGNHRHDRVSRYKTYSMLHPRYACLCNQSRLTLCKQSVVRRVVQAVDPLVRCIGQVYCRFALMLCHVLTDRQY